MKLTRLHAADKLTFTLTGPEVQRALTLAALHEIRLLHIRALPAGVQAQVAGVDWLRLQALLPVSYTHLDVYKRQAQRQPYQI